MNPEIAPQFAKLCERMQDIAWFSSVGESTQLALPFPHRFVRDAHAANQDIAKPEWADWILERRNDTTSFLHARCQNRYFGQWNKIAAIAKTFMRDEIEPKLVPALERVLPSPESALACVRWDVVSALMESAYADCKPPAFFTKLIIVYEAGHLPVGWDEATASGMLLVY